MVHCERGTFTVSSLNFNRWDRLKIIMKSQISCDSYRIRGAGIRKAGLIGGLPQLRIPMNPLLHWKEEFLGPPFKILLVLLKETETLSSFAKQGSRFTWLYSLSFTI